MKNFYLLIFIFGFLPSCLIAQSTHFTYDAAGNRMVRTYSAVACSSPEDNSSSGKKGESEDETSAQPNNNSAISNDDSGNKNPKENKEISNEVLNENSSYITITPNPTTGRAVIYFSPENITGLARLEITDVLSKKVFEKNPFAQGVNNYIDLSHLQKGVYFLKISTEDEVRVEKVVIE